MRRLCTLAAIGFICFSSTDIAVALDCAIKHGSNGRIERSTTAKSDFKRDNPCPETHQSTGPCPGYVIDHIVPLSMGGCDHPNNMQWQTTGEAKKKDKTERGGHACSAQTAKAH
jgi:hypothetical protein